MAGTMTAPPSSKRAQALHFSFNSWGCSPSWPKGHRLSRPFFRERLTDFTFWFFFEGRGTLLDRATKRTHPLHPGVALCLFPGMDLYVEQDDDAPLGNTWFHFDVFQGARKLPPQSWPYAPYHAEARNLPAADQCTRRILALLEHRLLPGYDPLEDAELEAEFLLKALLVELAREARMPRRDPLERHHETVIEALVAKLFADPRLFRRTTDLARAGGYSVSHFRTICGKFTGHTPGELLVQARIEKAKTYLRTPTFSVGMVADAVGYENIYYFSRQFHEIVGMTPKQFRACPHPSPQSSRPRS